MTLIRVKGGTENETAKKNKMHKSRRKIIDVMRGEDIKDTYGWTPTAGETAEKNEEERKKREERDSIFSDVRVHTCPDCGRLFDKLDRKFYYRTGHCFNCQQDFEHDLRVKGVYTLWEKMKVFQNEISILKDTRSKFQEAYDSIGPTSELVTSEGKIVKFEHLGNFEKVREDIKTKIADIDEILPVAEDELENIVKELREKNVKIYD